MARPVHMTTTRVRIAFGMLLAVLFIMHGVEPLHAQTLRAQLVRMLGEHDRVLAAANRANATDAEISEAFAAWLPRLDLNAEIAHDETDSSIDVVGYSSLPRNEERFRASQLLFDYTAIHAVSERRRLHETSLHQLEAVRQTLLFEGARAYLDLRRAAEQLAYAIRSQERIRNQTGIEETLVEIGAGLSSNVLQAKQQLAGAQARRARAEGDMERAAVRYRVLFGEDPPKGHEVVAETLAMPPAPFVLLPLTVEQATASGLEDNPAILAAGAEKSAAQTRLDQVDGRFMPRVEAFAEYRRDENTDGVERLRQSGSVGVSLSLNILEGGAKFHARRAAKARVREAAHSQADLGRDVRREVGLAWRELNTARMNYEYLKNQAALLGEFLELAKRERAMGNRSLLDVLAAEVEYINALSNAVAAQYDTYIAAYRVLWGMGALDLAAFEPRK